MIIPRTFDGKLPEIGLVSLVRTVPTKPTAVNIGDLALARRRVFGDETPGKLGFKLREYEPTETPESAVLEVATVEPGGPAAKAGLEVGDVITNIDGHDVSGGDPNGMYSVLLPVPPGTLVKLGVARGPVLSMTSVAAQ